MSEIPTSPSFEDESFQAQNKQTDSQQKPKKIWLGLGVIVAVLVILGVGGLIAKKTFLTPKEETPVPTPTKKVLEPVNMIELRERPFISLKPKTDGHNLYIDIASLPKPATSVEYELEYQTGSMLQGAFGEIELTDLPIEEEVFLGSCSAGGACTFHEDIKGGSILTRFKGDQNYALKSDFRWWEARRDDNQFASRDAKFQLTSDDLAKNAYVIIFNGAGLPDVDKLKGEIASDIYVIGASNHLKGKADSIKLRAKTNDATHIAYWIEGEGWEYLQANIGESEKELVAENVPLAQVYLAVKYTNYE